MTPLARPPCLATRRDAPPAVLGLGGRRGNLSVGPRKNLGPPFTGVRADPPVAAPDVPTSIHRSSALQTSHEDAERFISRPRIARSCRSRPAAAPEGDC